MPPFVIRAGCSSSRAGLNGGGDAPSAIFYPLG